MRLCADSNCKRVGQLLPDSEFYSSHYGEYQMKVCKECHKRKVTEQQRVRRANYRAAHPVKQRVYYW